ncbi:MULTISPECIES: sensor histidine kinase [unclassified Nocardioides]|uniref:sensor histidine kinase n=1 Tax=unclassified Nocardioides TaxID=2615069 RepID=UPI0009F15206|nr:MULTISPECIES: ATP-binding protein [unclassified Nocardioides]GAW51540.1 Multi-sensor signal transduction histidine kinas e [Nocardioides sp. PD653-B2]GAW56085.1 Multi-sensor signal transduction histidine kinase [Nocardioides sp. PD653]
MHSDDLTETVVKRDLVATVNHELRTPLTSILGYTDVLLDGSVGDLTPLQHRMVQRVESNSQRLLTLVENLLTLAGVGCGAFSMGHRPVDLVGVVSDSLARSGPAIKNGGLGLTADLGADPVPVLGDETQLGQMVSRLIDNAVVFSPPGGQLVVTLRPDCGDAVLTIADTGLGIAEADQEHLFTSFVRAPAAQTREIQGLGLGLAVVGSIVTAHGGEVTLSSTEGVGTVVTVRLPLAADDAATTPWPQLPGSAVYQGPRARGA